MGNNIAGAPLPTEQESGNIDPPRAVEQEINAMNATSLTDERARFIAEMRERVAKYKKPTLEGQLAANSRLAALLGPDNPLSKSFKNEQQTRYHFEYSANVEKANITYPVFNSLPEYYQFMQTNSCVDLRPSGSLEDKLKSDIIRLLHQHVPNSESETSTDEYTMVFVWDLDDMSIKRMNEILPHRRPDVDLMPLKKLCDSVLTSVNLINQDEIEGLDVMSFEEAINSNRDYAAKYQQLQNLYETVSEAEKEEDFIISHGLLEICGMIGEKDDFCQTASKIQELQHQRWKSVKKSLDLVNNKSIESKNHKYTNVVLSEEGVAQAAARLLVSRHSSAIPIENIYSSFGVLKNSAWKAIQRRFGANCKLIYLTSRTSSCPTDENGVSRLFDYGVGSVKNNDSIEYIYNAQLNTLQ